MRKKICISSPLPLQKKGTFKSHLLSFSAYILYGIILCCIWLYFTFAIKQNLELPDTRDTYIQNHITYLAKEHIYIVADSQGLFALGDRCTHAGCTVIPDSGFLVCPCHGAMYDNDGGVRRGPATKPLPRYYISINSNHRIVFDPTHTVDENFRLPLPPRKTEP